MLVAPIWFPAAATADTHLIIPDPRWEMPELLIPGRKPVGAVEVDVTHSLSDDLFLLHLPQKALVDVDLYGKRKPTVSGSSLSLGVSVGGVASTGATTAGNYIAYADSPDFDNPNITIFAVVRHTGSSYLSNTIACRNFTGGNVGFKLGGRTSAGGGGAHDGMSFYNGTWRYAGVPPDFTGDGLVHSITGTYDGNTLKYYQDGKLETSNSYAGTLPASTADIDIGSYQNDSTWWEGDIYCVMFFRRALNDAEIESLSANPYQFLVPA